MPHDISNWISDFGFFRLHQTLTELGVDNSTQSKVIAWYWQQASAWTQSCVSQIDFDATARTSIAAHVGKKFASRSVRRPAQPRKEPEPWEPCRHYGGVRLCPRCKSPVQPGAMARAERMWTQHRRFVLDRLDKEIPRYVGGRHAREYSRYEDVEQAVWTRVADKIEQFKPNCRLAANGQLAWLTTVVHNVVNDWFSTMFASKRDVRRETVLDRPDNVFADATRPAGEGRDRDDTEDAA